VSSLPFVQSNFSHMTPTEPNPIVQQFVDSISEAAIREEVSYLSNTFFTRVSTSPEAKDAARYLLAKFQALGCNSTALKDFRNGFSPNVECVVNGEALTEPFVVLGGHYDCIPATGRAPGADDNASGSAGIIEVLRQLMQLKRQGVKLRRTLRVLLFAGEEQGLVGSSAYVAAIADKKSVYAMVDIDMIGWPQPGFPERLYWLDSRVSPTLTQLGLDMTKMYITDDVQLSPACCSDQEPFNRAGIPAAAVAESRAYSNNPNYHRPSDTPDTLDYHHVTRTTMAAAALLATLLEPSQ